MVLSIDLICLGVCILVGLFVMKKYNLPIYLKILTITLIINFFVDTTTTILIYYDYHTNDIYNIYQIFYFELYLFTIYNIVKSKKAKRIMLNVMIGFALVGLINLLFVQLFQDFQSITYSLGSLIIVSFCIYYFYELFQRPTSVKLTYEPAFWITSGLLFYYACAFPMAAFINIVGGEISSNTIRVYQFVTVLINILLYSVFTIAFVCRVKIRSYTS